MGSGNSAALTGAVSFLPQLPRAELCWGRPPGCALMGGIGVQTARGSSQQDGQGEAAQETGSCSGAMSTGSLLKEKGPGQNTESKVGAACEDSSPPFRRADRPVFS